MVVFNWLYWVWEIKAAISDFVFGNATPWRMERNMLVAFLFVYHVTRPYKNNNKKTHYLLEVFRMVSTTFQDG